MILTVSANPAIDKAYFVESFSMGEVRRAISVTATAGGKGLNVSRVAHLLGTPVTAMGFAGGSAGDFIRSQIRQLGINDAFTSISGETRTCINIVDQDGVSGEILEPGPEITADDREAFFKEFELQLDSCSIVCASGSLPRKLTDDFYVELVDRTKKKGKRIIVDTSGNALPAVIDAAPFMIKPNRDELAQILGYSPLSDNDVVSALHLLKSKGVEIPMATLGKSGAMALIDGQIIRYTPPSVECINTVGSGDSTVAGIAVGLCHGLAIHDAVRLGIASGTANTQFKQTGMVTQALTKQYYYQTTYHS